MKKCFVIMLALAMLLGLAGCGSDGTGTGAQQEKAANADAADAYNYGTDETTEADAETTQSDASKSEGDVSSTYQNKKVKLIRRATLNLETREFDAAVSGLEKLVETLGGYVESSSVNQGSYDSTYRSASYTVRVPSGKYSEFLKRVSSDERCHLVDKDETTEDVGQEYFDTEVRLKTLRTKLERLQELLKKAKKIEEIITLENAISDTEFEIDQYTSTLNRYDSLIGYSTFQIYIKQVIALSDTDTSPYGIRLLNAFTGGLKSFCNGLQVFSLWLARYILSILVLIALILLARYLLRRRRQKKQRSGQVTAQRVRKPFVRKQNKVEGEMETKEETREDQPLS